jgi:Ca2+-binding RTX toxin-like protein
MATPFTVYTGSDTTALTNALLAPNSGINIVNGSIVLDPSGPGAVGFYDGSLGPLGIDAGLLLTSGTMPGTSNTMGWFGADNSWISGFYNGDADINAVVNTVFSTVSYDATTLSFSFTVTDPTATSVSFDLVFGSDEYPEWVDMYVDSAVVLVNGVNYALFNHNPAHPLSVVQANLNAGYFQNNAGGALPIEYDGVSHVLKIVAPIQAGTNTIKIGVADTGDHIYDSGLFIANMAAGNIPGSGVVITPDPGTDNSDSLSGTGKDEYFDLKGGDDTCYAGAGDDIVVAGSGNDTVYGGSGLDDLKGDSGDDYLDGGAGSDTAVYAGISTDYGVVYNGAGAGYTLTDGKAGAASEGADTLANIEFVKFGDGLFSLGPSGLAPVTVPPPTPTNTPGSVVITGIGSVGNDLTALVSDPDGVPAAVSYEWQSSADGVNWSTIGTDSSSYTVQAGDAERDIRVIATYTDNGATAESPVSAAKTILNAGGGDLVVTLLNLTAPEGTGVINPLTTLLKNAIDLGVSPNLAAQNLKAVLGIPAEVNLQTYDAWQVLQGNPSEPTALAVEQVAVQIAILTSLSDDDTGMDLTLAVLDAAAAGQTLDLSSLDDLSAILGIPAVLDPVTNKYPQPLDEIHDRNKTMADAVADGGDVSVIEQEWQDLLSIQDGIASTGIADLSIHVNQAPAGSATANLPVGAANTDYLIAEADLLAGFGDPDGDALAVADLTANGGGSLQDNFDGTWTFTPAPNYSGPVELGYSVVDGQGQSAPASQMFVIAAADAPPANHAPTVAVPLAGQAAVLDTAFGYAIPAGTFQDSDAGDVLTLGATLADGSPLPAWLSFDPATGTFSGTPTGADLGGLIVTVTATDTGGLGVSTNFDLTVAAFDPGQLFVATPGNDTFTGGPGVETVSYGQAGAAVAVSLAIATAQNTFGSGKDTFAAIDNLIGGAFNDKLTGDLGNNVLDGGAGIDALAGGGGDDTYVVDDGADKVVEGSGAGTDTVLAYTSYTLSGNVERLVLMGAGDLAGTGNTLANTLTGNAGNNVLNGGGGADTLTGGLGDDTYVVDHVGDVVQEDVDAGTDTVQSKVSYTLADTLEHLTLTGTSNVNGTGNGGDNTLTGNAGSNVLDGGAGADLLIGGLGNDTYILDDPGDTVSEIAGQGTDTVKSHFDYALAPELENLTLLGTANLNGTGNAGANVLTGNGGNNVLDGQGGADKLVGGGGDDTYIVDDGADKAVEGSGAGIDTVLAYTSYTLGGNVENLVLLGTADLAGTGNTLANTLTGNAGNNLLNGGGGADVLIGGLGDDTYVVDNLGDTVQEAVGAGTDTVQSKVSYTLSDTLEHLTLTGTANVNGTGNGGDNVLLGNAGRNSLNGGAGSDLLDGGAGNDSLSGGADADGFRFSTALGIANIDKLMDFVSGQDRIELDPAIFADLGASGPFAMDDTRFYAGAGATAAQDADDRLVYNASTGALYYDADGLGGAAAVQFAALVGTPGLAAGDLWVG